MNVTMRDSVEMLAGVPLIVVIPALVELAKTHGLPTRYAGLAALLFAWVLLVVGDIAVDGVPVDRPLAVTAARWFIGGLVYGLAAAGLYSQAKEIAGS